MDLNFAENKPTTTIEVKKFNLLTKEYAVHETIHYKPEVKWITNMDQRFKEKWEMVNIDNI